MVPTSVRIRIGHLFLSAALVVFITDELGFRLSFVKGQEWPLAIGLFLLGQFLRWPKTQEEYIAPFRQEGVGMKEALANFIRAAAWIGALMCAYYVGRSSTGSPVPATKLVSIYGFAVLTFALAVSISAAVFFGWRCRRSIGLGDISGATETQTEDESEEKGAMHGYPPPRNLKWGRFSDSQLPASHRSGAESMPRYIWIRREPGRNLTVRGDFDIEFRSDLYFLGNVPRDTNHNLVTTIKERRPTPEVLASIGEEIPRLCNEGCALQAALEHCHDAENTHLVEREIEGWFPRVRETVETNVGRTTANLIMGKEGQAPLKAKLAGRISRLVQLVEGTARYRSLQKSPFRLESGEILNPGEEAFSSSFGNSELSQMLRVGAIERC